MASLYPRLLGDIGGTHARFAWMDAGDRQPTQVRTYLCAEHASLGDAIGRYLSDQQRPRPAACALGIANPVTGDEVRMTNHHWAFSISALREQLAVPQLAVVNDFTALALSLPALAASELRPLGGQALSESQLRNPVAPLALLGAGTGLGVSGLLPGAPPQALAGEGGHATLAAMDDEEADVLEELRRDFGHVSAERALSGPGLVNLHRALSRLIGRPVEDLSPADLITRARDQQDPLCQRAIELFCRFLGGVAGNLALTLGAGAVYIGGGIAPRLLPELKASAFRERFEGKGRLQAMLAPIPCYVIDAEVSPALLGASRALDRQSD